MADQNFGHFGGYQQQMTPEQFARYRQLNAAFAGAFGNVGRAEYNNFDYNWYLGGGSQLLAHEISEDPGRAPGRQQALNDLLNFFGELGGAHGKAGQKIDTSQFFDPLRAGVDQAAGQAGRQVRGDINRSFRGAADRTNEALAGTGMGRSGVAAATHTGIQQGRAEAEAGALERIESERLRKQFDLNQKQIQMDYSEELHERGWDEQNVMNALQFQQELAMLQFQQAANYEEDDWLDYVSAGASVLDAIIPDSLTLGLG